MISVKFIHRDHISHVSSYRRVAMVESSLTFQGLVAQANQLFSDLKGICLSFSWIDEDGDFIRFTSDEELKDALRYFGVRGEKTIKFYLQDIDSVPKVIDTMPSVHENIKCDNCGICPIIGTRYKCVVRENYDLCGACERNGQPYSMLKIYTPSQSPAAMFVAIRDPDPEGNINCYDGGNYASFVCTDDNVFEMCDEIKKGIPVNLESDPDNTESVHTAVSSEKNITVDNISNEETVLPPPDEHILNKIVSPGDFVGIENLVRKGNRDVTEEISQEYPKIRFVRHVTYADGTAVQPGSSFLKVWRIRNDGDTDMADGFELVYCGGDDLGAPSATPLPSMRAGDEKDVAIRLFAPELTGRHISYFQVRAPDGTSFGHRIWTDIRVEEDIARTLDWFVVAEETEDTTESVSEQVVEYIPQDSTVSIDDGDAGQDHSSSQTDEYDDSEGLKNELNVLREMGFCDELTLPLLRARSDVSSSSAAELSSRSLDEIVLLLLEKL